MIDSTQATHATRDMQRAPATQAATASLPSDHEIRITRAFDAPPQTVFDAWTTPEHVARWWDPSRRPLARCEIDLRPGGAFRFEHERSADGPGHVFAGVYREITRPTRLVFATPSVSGGESIGTLEFQEGAGVTTLVMTISCRSKDDRDALLRMRVDAGTVRTLENLSDFLAAAA
jgi:uncharacterized protein YndB with AHSA1/START domain